VSVQVSGGSVKRLLFHPSVTSHQRALCLHMGAMSKFVKGNLHLSPLSRLIYLVQRRYTLLVLLLVINHVLRFKQSIFHSLELTILYMVFIINLLWLLIVIKIC